MMKIFNFIPFIRKSNITAKIYSNSLEYTLPDSYDTEMRLAKFSAEVIVDELMSRGYKVYADEWSIGAKLFYLEYPLTYTLQELGQMGADRMREIASSLISDSIDSLGIPADTKKIHIHRVNIAVAETLNFKLRVEIKYTIK